MIATRSASALLSALVSARHSIPLILISVTLGCGAPRYQAFRILKPTPDSDSVLTLGSIELGLLVGDEWIEVHALNRGTATVGIDFGQMQFIDATSGNHDLVSSNRMGTESSWNAVDAGATFTFRAGDSPVLRAVSHIAPAGLGAYRFPDVRLLRPGERADEVLYPAEHLTFESNRFVAGPLFCRRPVSSEPQRFTIVLSIQQAGHWNTAHIVAERLPKQTP